MKKWLFLAVMSVTLSACALTGADHMDLNDTAVAEVQTVPGAVVERMDNGSWIYSSYVYGIDRIWVDLIKVWVDIKVQNLTYHKTVGLIYTLNNWETSAVAYATYENGLADGFEQWGIDLGPWDDRYYSTFEYAIFVEMDGITYYDNNATQNYKVDL